MNETEYWGYLKIQGNILNKQSKEKKKKKHKAEPNTESRSCRNVSDRY